MSFIGGAECSTAANPLSQFTKHAQEDRSQYLDRLTGPRADGSTSSIRAQGPVGNQDAMMDGFLQTTPSSLPGTAALPAALHDVQHGLETLHVNAPRPVTGVADWRTEYNRSLENPSNLGAMADGMKGHAAALVDLRPTSFSTIEYGAFGNGQPAFDIAANGYGSPLSANGELQTSGLEAAAPTQKDAYRGALRTTDGLHGIRSVLSPSYGMRGTFTRYRGGLSGFPIYGPRTSATVPEGKGKGRVVELDDRQWEEQFARIDEQGQDKDAQARAAADAQLDELDRVVVSESSDQSDLESLWKGIRAEKGIDVPALRNDDVVLGDLNWDGGFDGVGIHDDSTRDPEMGDYVFEEDNPFREVADPFQEGMRIMQEGGNLSLAALAFEAVAWKEPNRAEAWSMLGHAQAQNEKESPAIRALEQALRVDPSDLSALMGLAVSYTNEGYDSSAYRTLQRWLATKYPDVVGPADTSLDTDFSLGDRQRLHDRVTELFIKAAQLSPAGEQMDPDVQVGLGVLFYGAEEYDKAVDCFSAALASTEAGTSNRREQLHLLWNRLGATLANSGRSEEAIAAYEKALTLRPNFVRARYNLGISCINMGVYEAAAQHLLGALAMHKVVEQDGRERARSVVGDESSISEHELDRLIVQHQNPSTNLFDTLRRVFVHMGRSDLADKVGPDIDLEAFRSEFDF